MNPVITQGADVAGGEQVLGFAASSATQCDFSHNGSTGVPLQLSSGKRVFFQTQGRATV